MTHYRTLFLDAIDAHIERHGMSRTRFGRTMMKDPTFVFRMEKGRNPRVVTVDKLLVKMGHEPVGQRFRDEVEAFLSRTGMKPYKLGEDALGDNTFVRRLRSGVSPRLRTVDRVRMWMRDAERASGSGTLDERPRRRRRASPPDDTEMFLSARKAAALLTLSPRALNRFREDGTGPPYFRLGHRIVYAREDLLDWVWSKRVSPES